MAEPNFFKKLLKGITPTEERKQEFLEGKELSERFFEVYEKEGYFRAKQLLEEQKAIEEGVSGEELAAMADKNDKAIMPKIEKFIKSPIDSTVKTVKDTFTKEPKIEETPRDLGLPPEENNEVSLRESFGNAVNSGLIKIPKGVINFGTLVYDAMQEEGIPVEEGATYKFNKAFEDTYLGIIEKESEEKANETVTGKITEALVSLYGAGKIAQKTAVPVVAKLSQKARQIAPLITNAVKRGTYLNTTKNSKTFLEAGKKATQLNKLNKLSKLDKFVGITVGGGLGVGALVAKEEDIGTFGDFISFIPTKLDKESREKAGDDALRQLHNDTITANGLFQGRFPVSFDGQTAANGAYTRFEFTDPTGIRTVTFPDATGTVAYTGADISTFTNDANYITNTGSTTGNAGTATKLQTARNFSITGAVTAGAVSFDGSGNAVLTTSFTNQNISQFTNDAGFVTDGLTTATPVSTLPNDAGYMSKWSIGADDSTMREVRADENIKIIGGGAVTTASDAEGNITVTASNNLSTYTNDAGFNTQNDIITLTGDVSGSGRTTINTTLNVALSNVTPGSYNYVTVDTKGIVQDAINKNYVEAGTGVSQLTNDAGYITSLGTSLTFIGDDSSGFGVPIPGNAIRFQGSNGVTVSAANETVSISGPVDANGLITADIKGSVFGDDSSTIIQGDTGYITTPVATINQFMNMAVLATEPSNPVDGMVAIASGEAGEWNPGGLSAGTKQMVVYLGAWRQIASGGGA